MPDLYAVTGDAFARIDLARDEVELSLEGSGARCLSVDPGDPRRAFVGTFDHGLRITEDGGGTWRADEDGLEDRRVLAVTAGPGVVYAGTEPSNLYRSADAGRTWEQFPSLRELPSEPQWSFPGRPWTHHVRTIALHPTDPDWLLVGIELGGVMRSTDGGATWVDHNPQTHSDAHWLLTHPRAPDRVYESAGQGVAVSEDRGESWQQIDEGLDRRYGWAIAVDREDPDLWYVAMSSGPFAAHGRGDGEGRIMRHANGGFTPVAGWGDAPALRRMPYALVTLPGEPRSLIAGLRGGLLMRSDDAGESWTQLPVKLPDIVDLAVASD